MGAVLSRAWRVIFGRRLPWSIFTYPASLDGRSIRLLTLVRPKWYAFNLSKPKLFIGIYRLDDLPKYVALSYTWGPAEGDLSSRGYEEVDKVHISLNQHSFPIYPNLMDGLYAMQRNWDFDDDTQHLWIDAICINQEDLAERASQVEMMNQIYKNASSTVVWLGKGDSETAAGLQLYKRILRVPSEDFAPYYQQYPNVAPPLDAFWQARGLPSPHDERAWEPLVRMFENRWFSRTWVIQEVTLSKNIIILWGSGGITWDSLGHVALAGRAARLGQAQALPAMSRYLSGEAEHASIKDWVVRDPLGNALQLWGNRHRYLRRDQAVVDDALLNEMRALCGCTEPTESSWLMYSSLINRWAGATDPRDKVFGHLGLLRDITRCDDMSAKFHASYSSLNTSSRVFEHITREYVEDTDSLAILMAVNDSPFLRDDSLPSWVPDLSRQQGLDLMWSIRPQFCAQGDELRKQDSPMNRRIKVDGRHICVHGTVVGTVSRRSCSLLDLTSKDWYIWVTHLLETSPTYRLTGESRVEAFWRTLLMNSVARKSPANLATGDMLRVFVLHCLARYYPGPETSDCDRVDKGFLHMIEHINELSETDSSSHMPSFRGLKDLMVQITGVAVEKVDLLTEDVVLQALGACVDKMATFLSGLDSSMVNRRFVISDEGHFVNAPMWSDVGDRIVILDSCPCPLILRRDLADLSCHNIMGSAYVHGIMHGEAISEDTRWEGFIIK